MAKRGFKIEPTSEFRRAPCDDTRHEPHDADLYLEMPSGAPLLALCREHMYELGELIMEKAHPLVCSRCRSLWENCFCMGGPRP